MATEARKAALVLHEKVVLADGAIMELVVWRLPEAAPERPHGLKYRLYFGRAGKCLVRYDNETGKGDHRHVIGRKEPYQFVSLPQLRLDFERDVMIFGGHDAKEDPGKRG